MTEPKLFVLHVLTQKHATQTYTPHVHIYAPSIHTTHTHTDPYRPQNALILQILLRVNTRDQSRQFIPPNQILKPKFSCSSRKMPIRIHL